MDNKIYIKEKRSYEIVSNTDKEFFLIHGYTGSPDDFFDFGEYFHKRFNATVKIPFLKEHNTNIKSLDDLGFKDFVLDIEKEIKNDLKKGKKIVLGGYSFGGQIALYLASKYPVKAVFTVSVPYKLRFPFNLKIIEFFGLFNKYWPKRKPTPYEKALYEKIGGIDNYQQAHIKGLEVVKQGNKLLNKVLIKVKAPCLNIQSKNDYLTDYKSSIVIDNKISSEIKESASLLSNTHDLFFSKERNKLRNIICTFLEKNDIFSKSNQKDTKDVSAIIPALNEEKRIGNILNVLCKTKIFNEIILVDDGSKDNTRKVVEEIMKNNPNVKFLRNNKNKGKAYSMDRGVRETSSKIIFFCDADLVGLTPKIVKSIIKPVVNGEVDMFIGIRKNFLQRAIKKFALDSGERALKREIWEKLPNFYKHRYRIEEGLNKYVEYFGNGFGYSVFNYTQTLKEVKYGFWKGFLLRIWMNFDVMIATFRFYFYDKFRLGNSFWN